MEPEVSRVVILNLEPASLEFEPYRAMVFSNYLHNLRGSNPALKCLNSRFYYKSQHEVLEKLLSRQGCTVRVAVLSDVPDVALGWSISRPNVLDFVFVKRDGRKQGIGRALLPASFSYVTHTTELGELLRQRFFPKVKFDPKK